MKVLYARIDVPLPQDRYKHYLAKLPVHLQSSIAKFHRWEDGHLSLFGKLLLLHALHELGFSGRTLQALMLDSYGRPYFTDGPSFNISHAANYVVCAIDTETSGVGIDIEKIGPIDVDDFENQWTDEEYRNIITCDDRLRQFFVYWTRKEAVVKADGRGLSIPLKDINVVDMQTKVDDRIWYLNEVGIDDQYICHLAAARQLKNINKQCLEF